MDRVALVGVQMHFQLRARGHSHQQILKNGPAIALDPKIEPIAILHAIPGGVGRAGLRRAAAPQPTVRMTGTESLVWSVGLFGFVVLMTDDVTRWQPRFFGPVARGLRWFNLRLLGLQKLGRGLSWRGRSSREVGIE